jgi:ribonucleoside-diphosphate reductase alpha chain
MRWLASRFLDTDVQEDLGILTPEVRARKMAEEALIAGRSDTEGPEAVPGNGGNGGGNGGSQPASSALTDTPPVQPAKMSAGSLELGPACSQCGGMMQRTGSCYTCSSCGNNTGCG